MDTVKLGTGNIRSIFFSLAGPSILAQIVTVIYNMVDRIYISQLPDSRSMMAAIGITAPISLIVTAFTALLGNGGAPLCAICLGRGKTEKGEHIMSNSFGALMAVGAVIMAVCLAFGEPLLYAFGARGVTLEYALSYLRIYICGTFFVQISVGMNAYINTQGFAKMGMLTVATGALLNVVLDPIMIYGLHMDVAGAALATVISQGVSAVMVMRFLLVGGSTLRLRWSLMKPNWPILRQIMLLGVSPFIMKLTESLLSIAFNNQLYRFGGDLAVSVMTIMNSVWQMAQLMTHGFTDGAQPILGYNYGAGKLDRVRSAFRLELLTCWGWTLLCAVVVLAFPSLFLRIFNADAETMVAGPAMLRVYFFGMICYGAFNACQQAYIALGNAKSSLFFAVFRKVILLIPLIYLFPALFQGDKVLAVLAAEPVADIVSTAVGGACFFSFYRKKLSIQPATPGKPV